MIRHIVMWRLCGDSADERTAARTQVTQAVEGPRGRIPGLLALEVGLDISGVDHACDVALVTDFDTRTRWPRTPCIPSTCGCALSWAT